MIPFIKKPLSQYFFITLVLSIGTFSNSLDETLEMSGKLSGGSGILTKEGAGTVKLLGTVDNT